MNYNHFDIEDFLTNEEFIRWAIDPTRDLDTFWQKWIEAHPEKREEVLQAKEILKAAKFNITPTNPQQYNRVLHKILEGKYALQGGGNYAGMERPKRKSIFFLRSLSGVAASLLILVTCGLVWYFNFNVDNAAPSAEKNIEWITKANPKGQKSTFALPDGTIVSLNSDSRLTYPTEFAGPRNVELEGEAFFEVAKDVHKPFTVKTNNITTTALGTSFNIKAFEQDEDISVSLYTGRVVVEKDKNEKSEKVYLDPGEKFTYDKAHQIIKKTRIAEGDLAWKNGTLVFNKSGLHDLIETVERWYGVEIQVEGSPDEKWAFSGRFENETLKVLLESISYTENVKYELKNENVKLIFDNQN